MLVNHFLEIMEYKLQLKEKMNRVGGAGVEQTVVGEMLSAMYF